MYLRIVEASFSAMVALGGMETSPQAPLPPVTIFLASRSGAEASPAYLAAIWVKLGPTSLPSTRWQALQLPWAMSAWATGKRAAAASPLARSFNLETSNPWAA